MANRMPTIASGIQIVAWLVGCLFSTAPGFAGLSYSTYLRDGFTPKAMTSDSQGNLYLAGNAATDPLSDTSSALVMKIDPKGGSVIYLQYLDSASLGGVSAIVVDSAGNAYVTGVTSNPNFAVIGGGSLGTPPVNSTRGYVTKIGPNGAILLSVLIGGSTPSTPLGIALTAQGEIVVSGISQADGFPVTPGSYQIPSSLGKWFLMKLDATASKVVFSATGIGGNSIALDAAGNIYVAGSSIGTDYPTTPEAYQTTFMQGHVCFGLCQFSFPGVLQHVTKVDPTGSKLIYSTGLNNTTGGAGSTTNTGLAVDAAGNAYVTGTLLEASYPFTARSSGSSNGFVTKLNPSGGGVVFSIPAGGSGYFNGPVLGAGGVVLDTAGSLYVATTLTTATPVGFGIIPPVVTLPDVLAWVPQPCRPNVVTSSSGSFVTKVDAVTGTVQDVQWLGGSATAAAALTFAGNKVWVAGYTPTADVPITVGAIVPGKLPPGPVPGAFLAAVDFSQPVAPTGGPAIACILDAGNLTHAGPVAIYQILSIFGLNLGPATGLAAMDSTTTSLGGVTVTFGGVPAILLYVSSTQINVLVPSPAPLPGIVQFPAASLMTISYNGATLQRQIPLTTFHLDLFADVAASDTPCPDTRLRFQLVALNADGTRNSCAKPAKAGSAVSVFVHGPGGNQIGLPLFPTLFGLEAKLGTCPAVVEKTTLTGLVYQVDLRLPGNLAACASSTSPVLLQLTMRYDDNPVGPLQPAAAVAVAQPLLLWATP